MLSFPPSPSVRIFIAREAIDMSKGLDGLSGLVIDVIDEDPQSGHFFDAAITFGSARLSNQPLNFSCPGKRGSFGRSRYLLV